MIVWPNPPLAIGDTTTDPNGRTYTGADETAVLFWHPDAAASPGGAGGQARTRDFTLAAGESVTVGQHGALNAAGELVQANSSDSERIYALEIIGVNGSTITTRYKEVVKAALTWDITDGGRTNSRVAVTGPTGEPEHDPTPGQTVQTYLYYVMDSPESPGDALFADIRTYVPLDTGDGFVDAPADGGGYIRVNNLWVDGVPAGGTTGQRLSKVDGTDHNTQWATPTVYGDMFIATYDAAAVSEQLVGLTATQTLTNKTVNGVVLDSVSAGNNFLADDGTYKAAVQVSQLNTFTEPQVYADQLLTFATTINLDASTGSGERDLLLTANITDFQVSNMAKNQYIVLNIFQDAGGGNDITFSGISGTAPTIDQASNAYTEVVIKQIASGPRFIGT